MDPGMITGRKPYLSNIAPGYEITVVRHVKRTMLSRIIYYLPAKHPPMYKKKAYKLTTHAVWDFGSAASWFSEIQASSTPMVLSIPIDGIMAHQAPRTTDQARQPPSGNSSSMSTLEDCWCSLSTGKGEVIMYWCDEAVVWRGTDVEFDDTSMIRSSCVGFVACKSERKKKGS